MNPFIQVKTTASLFLTIVCLICLWFLPTARAISPAPDGCYSDFTTAEGCNALNFLTTGAANTGLGWHALFSASTGAFNTGVGGGALVLNNADSNTAVGAAALLLNTTGTLNTAVGTAAMVSNNLGDNNAAFGAFALNKSVSGDDNTAVGEEALELNVSAFTNVAVGTFAAENNDSSGTGTATSNVAVGGFALQENVDGARNTAVGAGAIETGSGGSDNTAVGEVAGNGTTGNFNTALGSGTGQGVAGGEGNIYIGAHVQPGFSNEFEMIRIGDDTAFTFPYDTYIAGIYGRGVGPAPLAVVCANDGKLSTNASSRRFKHDIKPMDKASEAILALKPVSFVYNDDPTNLPWFGLIAEEVAQVNEALIVRDKEGKPFGVRYDAVNAMLLNEFLKEHRKVESLEKAMAEQQNENAAMRAMLKEQAAEIQQVSAQLEVNNAVPQAVLNH
jgi:hypothetical protein